MIKVTNKLGEETGSSISSDKNQRGVGKGYEWVVLSVTTVGALLASIQESALLIALPDILRALQMQFLTLLWVLLIYLLLTTVMVPIFGRLSDMFGRKRLYVLGFGLFTLGSLNPSSTAGTSWGIESSRGWEELYSWQTVPP